MRKTTILAVLAFVVTLCSFNSNAQVNVGTGTLTGQSLPIDPYYGYTYSQSIYLASEINAAGSITGITFYGDAGISALSNSDDWVVYVGHTTKTSFANSSDWETGLTQVFAGTISVVGNNVTVTFSTPFVYNGTDNLIVAVDENGASFDNNSDEFLCTSTANDRSLTYRNDSTNPDPLGTLPSAVFIRQAIPNIQFIGITQTCPLPSALTATNITVNSADFGWTENGTASTWNVEYGTAGFTPSGTPNISGTTSNPVTIGSLMDDTSYDAYVQADCGPDSSAWVGPFTFTTLQSCPDPSALMISNITSSSADFGWTENGSASTWNVEFGTAGFTPTGTPTISGTTSNPVTLSSLTDNTTYDAYVQADCGADSSAWIGPVTFTTECAALAAPWLEPFSTNSLPTCWSQSGDNNWEYGSSATTPTGFTDYGAAGVPDHSTGGGGTFIGMDGSDNGSGDVSVLLTPSIDVSGLTNGQFSYWVFSNNIDDATQNKLIVEVFDGAAWVQVDSIQQNLGTDWVEFSTPLSSLTITGDVKARFTITGDNSVGVSTYYNDILIDDVAFNEIPTCPIPTALTISNIEATAADFGWTENGPATTWNVEYGTAGFTPTGTPTISGTTSNPVTLTSLTGNTTYDVYLQSDCGPDSSTWVGPISFTTACATYIPDYLEDFTTFLPECWERSQGLLTSSTVLTPGTSSWLSDGFANVGSSGAARMNIYTTGQDEWLISPSIDLTGGPFQLEYDVALTTYYGTSATTMDADDSLAVVISTDDGATWSNANILKAYTSGSEPSNTGDHEYIDLSAYSGVVKFGFYAASTQNLTVDNNISIDNFEVKALCLPEYTTDVQTACEPFTWIDGNTYTSSNNTATVTFTNTAGCDSIVTLDLTIGTPTFGTDVQTACDSFTWIDGNTYTSSNNTATDTLMNTTGCDSIVTLDLTILNSTSGTDVQSACGSYTWIDGNTYTSSNNTATFTLSNSAGCDSIVTLDLTIVPAPNTGVTVSGATVTADITLTAGVSLSWLDCDAGFAPVPGETAQSFTPTSNGNYALRVVENTCVDTSACFLIDEVGLSGTDFTSVSIVPNPTNNVVNITFEDAQAELTILDINGKLIDQMTIKSGDTVDMTLFENGVYLFTLTSDSIRTIERVVKQ